MLSRSRSVTRSTITLARALHVLAITFWIGGAAMVTTVILPAIARYSVAAERLASFNAIEGRFATQAKVAVTLAGLSGFYMLWRLELWSHFLQPAYWWMHAMVLVWAVFSVILFIAEALFLHAWFERRAARDAEGAFKLVQRAHWVVAQCQCADPGRRHARCAWSAVVGMSANSTYSDTR